MTTPRTPSTLEEQLRALHALRCPWGSSNVNGGDCGEEGCTVRRIIGQAAAIGRAAGMEEAAKLRAVAEAFCDTVDGAVAHFENKGKGGQHVPYHGDFASGPPSTISRLKWWAREFRAAAKRTEGGGP